jgi:hypothetical protein
LPSAFCLLPFAFCLYFPDRGSIAASPLSRFRVTSVVVSCP